MFSFNDSDLVSVGSSNPYQLEENDKNGTTKTYRYTSGNIGSEPSTAVGEIKEVRQTFLNAVDSLISTFSYWEDSNGVMVLPDLVETKKGDQTIAKMSATITQPTLLSKSIIKSVRSHSADSTDSYSTTVKTFRPDDADAHLQGKTISVERPDGSKTSFLIQKGYYYWDGLAYKFVWVDSASRNGIRVVALNGKPTTPVPTLPPTQVRISTTWKWKPCLGEPATEKTSYMNSGMTNRADSAIKPLMYSWAVATSVSFLTEAILTMSMGI